MNLKLNFTHGNQHSQKAVKNTNRNSETRSNLQKTQDPRGREINQVSKEKDLRERNKKIASRKNLLMNHLKVILILFLQNISSEIIHADVVVSAMIDEASSISSEIVEQIEFLPEVFLKYLNWLTQ